MLGGESPGIALTTNFFMLKITKATTKEQVNSWNLARDTLTFCSMGRCQGRNRRRRSLSQAAPMKVNVFISIRQTRGTTTQTCRGKYTNRYFFF